MFESQVEVTIRIKATRICGTKSRDMDFPFSCSQCNITCTMNTIDLDFRCLFLQSTYLCAIFIDRSLGRRINIPLTVNLEKVG